MGISFLLLALLLRISQNQADCQFPMQTLYKGYSTTSSEDNRLPGFSESSINSSSFKRTLSDLQDTPFFSLRQVTLTTISDTPLAPSVIEGNSRNIFIAYHSGSGDPKIYGQVFTEDLVEYISEFDITSNPSGYNINPAKTCLLHDQKILVVWEYFGSSYYVYGKIFNPDFTEFLSEFAITDDGSNFMSSVDSFATGGFILVSVKNSATFQREIYYRIYDQTGNGLIEETRVNDIVNNHEEYPKIGCFNDNSFVIAWVTTEDYSKGELKAKIFDMQGNVLTNEFQIAQNIKYVVYPYLCVFSDNRFLIVWVSEDSNTNFYHIYGRIYDYRGNPLSTEFLINNPSVNEEANLNTAILEDGGFVVTWRRDISSVYYIYAQRLNSKGDKIDVEFPLSSSSSNFNFQSVVSLKNGGYAVSWNEEVASQKSIVLKIAEPCKSINCRDCSIHKNICSLCKDGFILIDNPTADSDPCAPCDSFCLTCSGISNNECLSCIESLNLVNGSCLCEDGRQPNSSVQCECPDSSFDTLSDPIECSACPLYCQSCSSEDSCSLCDDGLFLEQQQCKSCNQNCKRCSGENDCNECKDTFQLQQGECVCPANYVLEQGEDGENKCVYKILSFSFSFSYDLVFDKQLSSPLSLSNIAYSFFLPSLQNFTFSVSSSSLSRYSLTISSSVPSESTSIRFRLKNVQATDGSRIREEEREVTADVLYIDELEEKLEEEMIPEQIPVSISTAGSILAVAGVGSSIGISILSFQPSALWNFLNVAIIVYLSPLQNIRAPEAFKNFTEPFGGNVFGIIPNLGLLFDVEEQQIDSDLLQDYNISSSNLLINSGVTLFVFCVGLLALPIFIALYYIFYKTSLSEFFLRRVKDYRWEFFVRSLIQIYTEIMFFSVVSLKWSSFSSLDFILSGIFVCSGVAFIFVSTFFTIKYREKIEEGSLGNFGSLFEELETKKGLMISLFYQFFLFRRLLFCLGAHFLSRYSFIQVIMNTSGCVVFVGYLICFRPFKDRSILFLNVISEMFLGVFLGLSGCFLLDLSDESVLFVCQLCVLSITIIPFMNLTMFTAKGLNRLNICRRCFKCFQKKRELRVNTLNYIENETIIFQRCPPKTVR